MKTTQPNPELSAPATAEGRAWAATLPVKHAVQVNRWWAHEGTHGPEGDPDGYTVTDIRTGNVYGPFTDDRGLSKARVKAMACRRKLMA
jgi:hypothetical protein